MRDRPCCSSCRGDADINAVVAHLSLDRAQAIFRVAAVAAGLDVEFPAMPRADDVTFFGETQPAAPLIRRELFLDPRDHLALTDRAAVVRAIVLVGDKAVAFAKDSELEAVDPQHAVATLGELTELAHHDLIHSLHLHLVSVHSRESGNPRPRSVALGPRLRGDERKQKRSFIHARRGGTTFADRKN